MVPSLWPTTSSRAYDKKLMDPKLNQLLLVTFLKMKAASVRVASLRELLMWCLNQAGLKITCD